MIAKVRVQEVEYDTTDYRVTSSTDMDLIADEVSVEVASATSSASPIENKHRTECRVDVIIIIIIIIIARPSASRRKGQVPIHRRERNYTEESGASLD
ncbi:hypothetical protein EVAR_93988_1 [Eumeta japonica]|uniref:Uncharacterized protein n=1 Tax=Eumeta variegata TaxID=151549 RepID=A0A4C1TPC4_EUMVA|nr:hypothetical protein EVAR_93988_1 [Eumeta japonica]